MGSKLLNGSPQLNVRVTLFPLILILSVTSETTAGTPVQQIYIYVVTYVLHIKIKVFLTQEV